MVIIGHVGFATDVTERKTVTDIGGSGFAAAFAASALVDCVGLVAQVGEDFNLDVFQLLPMNIEGIVVLSGASAKFSIDQSRNGSVLFSSDLGVAADPCFHLFPASYSQARHVHLGTAPPSQQLAWLEFLRDQGNRAQISVDMFEPFVETEPDTCRTICDRADRIFLNEIEYRALYSRQPHPSVPIILKHGAAGAELLSGDARHAVPAPSVEEKDSVGAGEILAGAFLALSVQGLTDQQSLSYAVAIASQSVTEFGVVGPAVSGELQRVREKLKSKGE